MSGESKGPEVIRKNVSEAKKDKPFSFCSIMASS